MRKLYYSHRIFGLDTYTSIEVANVKKKVLKAISKYVKKSHKMQVIDPSEIESTFATRQHIVANDLQLIDMSSAFIIDLTNGVGAGSSMELFYAKHAMNRFTIGIVASSDEDPELSLWVTSHIDIFVALDSLEDLGTILNQRCKLGII